LRRGAAILPEGMRRDRLIAGIDVGLSCIFVSLFPMRA